MWTLILVIALSSLAVAIKVPIVSLEDTGNDSSNTDISQRLSNKPIYYTADESSPDGYLIPPIPHKHQEVIHEAIATPAAFLLPPSTTIIDYYKNQEAVQQNDWYPIAPEPPHNMPYQQLIPKSPELTEIVIGNHRNGKVLQKDGNVLPPTPARGLLPPLENAPNFYFDDSPLTETGSLDQELKLKYKKPTGLYPKKVVGHFNPIPIPVAQFADSLVEIPKAKPINAFRPLSGVEGVYLTPSDEKKIFLYKKEEQKRKLRGENEEEKRFDATTEKNKGDEKITVSEQETSETNNHQPKHDFHPAPEKQVRKRPVYVPANKGERTEFRMHGMNGPHSYQFGFDTGKGKNRQFRYEERDNDGHVRGHYGYVDKLGKMRVVNYDADPQLGFRADPPVVQE